MMREAPPRTAPIPGLPSNCLWLLKDPEVVPERARALSPLPTWEAKDTLVDAGFYPFPAPLLLAIAKSSAGRC